MNPYTAVAHLLPETDATEGRMLEAVRRSALLEGVATGPQAALL